MNTKELLSVYDIRKTYPGVKALKGVNLQVLSGEVHALVGENGAGKSTLIKCIMGVVKKDPGFGAIKIDGKTVDINSPTHAKQLGLGAVYQDVMLAKHLTVGENFFLGALPSQYGLIKWKEVHRKASQILSELNIVIDTKRLLKDLSIAEQEMVAIAKIVSDKSKVIIFDEPTALLSNEETEVLFKLIETLKNRGMGIIYISHRMEEIFRITQRITILKDGTYVDTLKTTETNEDELIRRMVGRSVINMYSIDKPITGDTLLKVENLTIKNKFENISFDVKKGEIFGIFGLVGAGRTEIMEAIFGSRQFDSGVIYIDGEKVAIKKPVDGIKHGIAFITEDRKETGLFMELPCTYNTNMISYKKISKFGVISGHKESENSDFYKRNLGIKTPTMASPVKSLSGGNQQKVVLSKWLATDCKIFLIDEPTVGVDVGAKVEIYKLIESLIKKGNIVIMVSSYLPEVMGLADRVLVIANGKQMKIINKDNFKLSNQNDEEYFLRLASGIKHDG